MADLRQLETALINADKAGDTAAAKIFAAEIMKMRSPQEPFKVGAEALPGFIKEEAKSRSVPTQMLAGAGTALDNAAMRLKQLVTGLAPEDEARVEANRGLTSTGAGLTGAVAGNIGLLAAPGANLQMAATNLAARFLPALIAPTVGAGVTGGAIAGATNPVLTGESEFANMGLGFLGGALGDVAARGLARVAQPLTRSSEVNKLVREGVIPSPGQAAGSNSFLGRVEQKLQSLPLVGDIIKRGRERATEEFNLAAISRALPKDDKGVVTKAGRAAIDKADEVLGSAYDKVYSGITVKPDRQFLQEVVSIKKNPDLSLPKELQGRFDEIIRNQVLSRVKGGEIKGLLAQRIDSQLGTLARRYTSDLDADKRVLGLAFREAQKSFKGLVERSAGPEVADTIKGLNSNYANLLRVERAAASQGAKDGVFSANQLSSAVKALDKSSNKNAFARGSAVMQDLSDAAKNVLGDTVPNSGTTDRLLMGLAAGGIGANEYFGGPEYLSMLAAAPLLYSRAGSRYLLGDYAGQQAVAEALRKTAPYASQLGRSVLTEK